MLVHFSVRSPELEGNIILQLVKALQTVHKRSPKRVILARQDLWASGWTSDLVLEMRNCNTNRKYDSLASSNPWFVLLLRISGVGRVKLAKLPAQNWAPGGARRRSGLGRFLCSCFSMGLTRPTLTTAWTTHSTR